MSSTTASVPRKPLRLVLSNKRPTASACAEEVARVKRSKVDAPVVKEEEKDEDEKPESKVSSPSYSSEEEEEEEPEDEEGEEKEEVKAPPKRKMAPRKRAPAKRSAVAKKKEDETKAISEVHELAGALIDKAFKVHDEYKREHLRTKASNIAMKEARKEYKDEAIAKAAWQKEYDEYKPKSTNYALNTLKSFIRSLSCNEERYRYYGAQSKLFLSTIAVAKLCKRATSETTRDAMVKVALDSYATEEKEVKACSHVKLERDAFALLWRLCNDHVFIKEQLADVYYSSSDIVKHTHMLFAQEQEGVKESGAERYAAVFHAAWTSIQSALSVKGKKKHTLGDVIRTLRFSNTAAAATSSTSSSSRGATLTDKRVACIAAILVLRAFCGDHMMCAFEDVSQRRTDAFADAFIQLKKDKENRRAMSVMELGSITFGGVRLDLPLSQRADIVSSNPACSTTIHGCTLYLPFYAKCYRRYEVRELSKRDQEAKNRMTRVLAAMQGKTTDKIAHELDNAPTSVELHLHPAAHAHLYDAFCLVIKKRGGSWQPLTPMLPTNERNINALSTYNESLMSRTALLANAKNLPDEVSAKAHHETKLQLERWIDRMIAMPKCPLPELEAETKRAFWAATDKLAELVAELAADNLKRSDTLGTRCERPHSSAHIGLPTATTTTTPFGDSSSLVDTADDGEHGEKEGEFKLEVVEDKEKKGEDNDTFAIKVGKVCCGVQRVCDKFSCGISEGSLPGFRNWTDQWCFHPQSVEDTARALEGLLPPSYTCESLIHTVMYRATLPHDYHFSTKAGHEYSSLNHFAHDLRSRHDKNRTVLGAGKLLFLMKFLTSKCPTSLIAYIFECCGYVLPPPRLHTAVNLVY